MHRLSFVLQGVVLVGGSPAMYGQDRAQACARTADLHLVLRHAARATMSCTTFFAKRRSGVGSIGLPRRMPSVTHALSAPLLWPVREAQ